MLCAHNSCQQQVFGKHKLCYYHRKVENKLLSIEDRGCYLHSDAERMFAKLTDEVDKTNELKELHKELESPVSVEIIKLALYILAKQTKQQVSYFKGDVYIALMVAMLFGCDFKEGKYLVENKKKFVQFHAMNIASEILRHYKKEVEYQKYEISVDPARLRGANPEEEIIREQEEHLRQRAFYTAKKQMTKVERKVFTLLEGGADEIYVRNRLRLSKQRVNKLKCRACERVQVCMREYENYS